MELCNKIGKTNFLHITTGYMDMRHLGGSCSDRVTGERIVRIHFTAHVASCSPDRLQVMACKTHMVDSYDIISALTCTNDRMTRPKDILR